MHAFLEIVRSHWTFALLAIPGACVVLYFLAGTLPSRPRRLCPGTTRAWHHDLGLIALFRKWFLFEHCGYDLSGCTPGPRAIVQCPECGRHVHPVHFVSRARGIRRRRVAGTLLLLLLVIWKLPGYRDGEFARNLPTSWLIAFEDTAPRLFPPTLDHELSARIYAGTLTPQEMDALTPVLLRDLRDDDVPGNGHRATQLLSEFAVLQLKTLEQHLYSPDPQERRLVAALLRECQWYTSSQRHYEVLIESIADDHPPLQNRRTAVGNAHAARAYLVDHIADAQPALAAALTSTDLETRFSAAQVVALGHASSLYGDAAAPLLGRWLEGPPAMKDRALAAIRAMSQDTFTRLAAGVPTDSRLGARVARLAQALAEPH